MSRDRKKPRFRHRIKDLMILNAVLAITLGGAIALGRHINIYQFCLLVGIILVAVAAPVSWVEIYLYRKKHGLLYHWRNPRKPRPRYQRPTDLPLYSPWVPGQDEPSKSSPRTRLFEAGAPSEPVSRASILLTVARQFESSGRMDAAAKIYHQILDRFASSAEARDAAHRLQSLSEK